MIGARGAFAASLLLLNRAIARNLSATAISGAATIVFAPHPDDEVLGCGGVLALKAEAGTRAKVVVMTDGRRSHSNCIDAANLVQIRRTEAEEAGKRLGISLPYEFLDFEDHRLSDHRESAFWRVVDVIRGFEADEIYVPHARDLISDHVETNFIVRRAIEYTCRPVVLMEYPVWLWNVWPWSPHSRRHHGRFHARTLASLADLLAIVIGCRARCDIRSVTQVKSSALAAYRSQMERLNGSPRWAILADVSSGDFLRNFQRRSELFHRTVYRP
jgi:LmbE family N-acetylglucosaminyl deacetylase